MSSGPFEQTSFPGGYAAFPINIFLFYCILKRKNHLLFSDCVKDGVGFPVLKGIISPGIE